MSRDSGSAVVEFVLVAMLLTVLTLSAMQLGLALHVRNTVLDAAAEGARFGALADNGPRDGVERTRALIAEAVGPEFADRVVATTGSWRGRPAITVTVTTRLPVMGLIGIPRALEVSGHAVVETLPGR